MTVTFVYLLAGALYMIAGIQSRSVLDVLRGTISPETGPGERGFAALLIPDVSGRRSPSTFAATGKRSGTSTYKGVELCNWIITIIKAAERDVGPLQPTSGVRRGVDPHTASGQTEHSGCSGKGGPGSGAVDFGGYEGSADAEKFRKWLARNGWPLKDAAHAGYHDLGHFSKDGH